MTTTKAIINSYVGDTIHVRVPIEYNGSFGEDLSLVMPRARLNSDPVLQAVIKKENMDMGEFEFIFSNTQTGTLSPGKYHIFAKLQLDNGDEYTVLDASTTFKKEMIS